LICDFGFPAEWEDCRRENDSTFQRSQDLEMGIRMENGVQTERLETEKWERELNHRGAGDPEFKTES
jgi:hypothetical protein